MATPYKIDKLGNVTDRETGHLLGFVMISEYQRPRAVFSHIPNTDEHGSDVCTAWDKFIEEFGRLPHIETEFKTRKEAAEFLWETREFPRESFPPPPFKQPYNDGRHQCLGENVRGDWARVKTSIKPHFEPLYNEDGSTRWGAYGRVETLIPGTVVSLWKRNGSEVPNITVGKIVHTTELFGVQFVTTEIVRDTPPRKPRAYRSSSSSSHRRFRRECPGCGEEIGGMWNGRRCIECGWG